MISGNPVPEDSAFTVKLYAIMETANSIFSKGVESYRYTISGSHSNRMAFKPMKKTSPISQKIRELLQKARALDLLIELCWVLGQTNVEIKADTIARDVSRMTSTRVIPHTVMKRPVFAAVKQNWLEKLQLLNSKGDQLR